VGLWGMAGAVGLTFVGLRMVVANGAAMEPPVGVALLLTAGAFGWATAAAGVQIGPRRRGRRTLTRSVGHRLRDGRGALPAWHQGVVDRDRQHRW
jgi:hypothetical protein